MDKRLLRLGVVNVAAILMATACGPKPATPPADAMASAVAQAALRLLTETAAASSPTAPPASSTPSPTAAPTAAVTATPLYASPLVLNFAGCYFGPGPQYTMESNIAQGKRIELLGVGSEPGWYIVRNPYFHRPCWIAAANLKIYQGIDVAKLPVMTPGVPLAGQ